VEDSSAQLITGDPLICTACKAIFNFESKIKGKVWVCEFCGNKNEAVLEEEEKPSKPISEYSRSPVSEKGNKAQEVGSSDDNNDALVLFVIDISGSMGMTSNVSGKWVSRLESVQKAIEGQLDYLVKNTPKKRVAFITFSNEVSVYANKTITIKGAILNDYAKLLEQAQEINIDEPISSSHARLKTQLGQLVESGATALGPAITIGMVIASKHPGSKCFICTDGMANKGVGELGSDHNKMEAFYNGQIAQYAKRQGVIISIISIQGSDTRLEYLGMLADATGGNVDLVQATDLDFTNMVRTVVLGTCCQATIIGPTSLTILSNELPSNSNTNIKEKYAQNDVIDLGNITKETEVTFEFLVNTEKVPTNVPIQIQLSYIKLSGTKVLKTITKIIPTSKDQVQVEFNVDVRVVSANAAQQCSRLAKKGNYKEARQKANLTQAMLLKAIHTQEQKDLFKLFEETVAGVFKQLDHAEEGEKMENIDISKMSGDAVLSYRAKNRSDESAKLMYDLKHAKSAACSVI